MGCGQVPDGEINLLFESLQYYNTNNNNNNSNQNNNNRHIFINVYDAIMTKRQINSNNNHITLTSGPTRVTSSGIIVPIFHDDPKYQPSNSIQSSSLLSLSWLDEMRNQDGDDDDDDDDSVVRSTTAGGGGGGGVPSSSSLVSRRPFRRRKYAFVNFYGGMNPRMKAEMETAKTVPGIFLEKP